MKKAIFIFGTPGSGKGTQANLLSWTKGFYHWDSGKELRGILFDPANQNDPFIKKERELNEAGILNTPSWVLGMFTKAATRISNAGMSIVYSGSPRTMYEAFGDESTQGLIPFLQESYGAENVHAFYLNVAAEIAASRNAIRRTCTVCTNPVLGDAPVTACPICEGELKVRKDDDPEKYKVRYNEYVTRTLPILDEMKKRGMKIVELKADRKPPEVFADIKKELEF